MSIKSSERNFARRLDLTSLQLAVGAMPQRAFDLMHGVGELVSITLLDSWAARQIQLVARDFSTTPLTARLPVDHLAQRPFSA